jgi:hypothetical protein
LNTLIVEDTHSLVNDVLYNISQRTPNDILNLRLDTTYAIAFSNIDWNRPRIDELCAEIQRAGKMSPNALKIISEMANELEVLGIVDPKLQWSSAGTFWMKELAKSISGKGGYHVLKFLRYMNDYVVPAINSVEGLFVKLKQTAAAVYNYSIQNLLQKKAYLRFQ